jgi:hypothetical protein
LTQLLHAEIQPNSGRTGFREETDQTAKGILIVTTKKPNLQNSYSLEKKCSICTVEKGQSDVQMPTS